MRSADAKLQTAGAPPAAGGEAAWPIHRYAEMVAEGQRLHLTGYKVYRFDAAGFAYFDSERPSIAPNAQATMSAFFDKLLRKHQII